ncbi:sugar kinase [Conexibacter sp. CPCC 206217]|uniref:sugar kinase n=1 Tax=Conexibacter sp. CPCC 206217 TaxID=3064574 RepID=UPI00271E8E54|nr:sugar kinase [Conexibacter sp. CPCC 206217]MDO8211229.1 sugar kinase [Conexibacter sp. CPCC 206217]
MTGVRDGGGDIAPAGRTARIATLGEGLLEVGVHPNLGDDVLARGYGGDAANVAVMAARLGASTRLLTRVGDDAAGRLLLDFWGRAGVDLQHVARDAEAPTGLYVNEVDDAGRHQFSFHRAGSAASLLGPADVRDEWFEQLDVLHATGIGLSISATAADAVELAVERARTAGAAISFTVNFRPQLRPDRERLKALARRADVLFLSIEDGRSLLGETDVVEMVAALDAPGAEVIVTQGEEPAWLFAGGESFSIAPPPVLLVDAAGAGDALAGTYLARRYSGAAPAAALTAGVAASSLSCQASGCALGYPTAADVDAAIERLTLVPQTGVLR